MSEEAPKQQEGILDVEYPNADESSSRSAVGAFSLVVNTYEPKAEKDLATIANIARDVANRIKGEQNCLFFHVFQTTQWFNNHGKRVVLVVQGYASRSTGDDLYSQYVTPIHDQIAPFLRPGGLVMGLRSKAAGGFDWGRHAGTNSTD